MPDIDLTLLVGQWMITESSEENEQLIVNLDRLGPPSRLTGTASYTHYNSRQFGQQYSVAVSSTAGSLEAVAELVADFDEHFRRRVAPGQPQPPLKATISLRGNGHDADVAMSMPDGTRKEFGLTRMPLDRVYNSVAHAMTWPTYRDWAFTHTQSRRLFVYRGQRRNTYPLRTAFHRTGRCDLRRYLNREVQELHNRVSAMTARRFELRDLDQLIDLMSVAQHHGYPTPFLDWTESPFIAAYFAFARNRLRKDEAPAKVRIFQCDATVLNPIPPPLELLDPRFMVGVVPSGTIDNPRAVPQQSVFMFSNLVDIEGFFVQLAALHSRPILTLVDLELGEADVALRDLRAMGITEGSMFPGVDGTCRELDDLHFGSGAI